eukprot:109851_1
MGCSCVQQSNSNVEQSNSNVEQSLVIRWLTSSEQIETAQRILYEVYIKEMNWEFSSNTPSELRIAKTNGNEYILVDKYTDTAKWIGGFINGEMIGCFRAIIRSKSVNDNKLELETYSTFHLAKLSDQICPDSFEINRLAILPKYRGDGIAGYMFVFIAKYVVDNNKSVITTTSSKKLINHHVLKHAAKIGVFKYEETDPEEVDILYFTSTIALSVCKAAGLWLNFKYTNSKELRALHVNLTKK